MLNDALMQEFYYNEIVDAPEKAGYVNKLLIPSITIMSLLVIAIIILFVFVLKRCKRKTAIILSILTAIILLLDVAAIFADYAILHYCLTGEEFLYKYGAVIARALNGGFFCLCLDARILILNIIVIYVLVVVFLITKKKPSAKYC